MKSTPTTPGHLRGTGPALALRCTRSLPRTRITGRSNAFVIEDNLASAQDGSISVDGSEGPGFLLVKHSRDQVFLTLSLQRNGDCQVVLTRDDVSTVISTMQGRQSLSLPTRDTRDPGNLHVGWKARGATLSFRPEDGGGVDLELDDSIIEELVEILKRAATS